MSGSEIATLILAAYGATLSTLLGLRDILRGTRRIGVHCSMGLSAPPQGGLLDLVAIQSVNKHPRPVTIVAAGIEMSNRRFFTQAASSMGRMPLPIKLEFGEAVNLYFDLPELRRVMAEKVNAGAKLISAFVRDAEGKEYTCRLPKQLRQLRPG